MSFHKKLGSFLLGLAVAVGSVVLGQVPISGLPPANLPLTGAEQVVMVQTQNGKKITVQAPSVLVGPVIPYSAAIGGTGEAGTITGVPMANGTSPFTQATGAQIAAPFTGCSPINPLLSWLGTCQLNTANPTATIVLSAQNGTATTFMRSDAAPALSQAITPTWTGLHKFTGNAGAGQIQFGAAGTYTPPSLSTGVFNYDSTGGDLTIDARSNGGNTTIRFRTSNGGVDAQAAEIFQDGGVTVGTPSGGNQGAGTLNMQGCFVNGVACSVGGSSGANPTGTVGLTAVNGSAGTFLRSDGAPALSQSIAPTWTGTHGFNGQYATSTATSVTSPGQNGITFINSGAGANAKIWDILQSTANHLVFRSVDDAFGSADNWLEAIRSGLAISSLTFGNSADNPTFTFAGTGTTSFSGGVTVSLSSGPNFVANATSTHPGFQLNISGARKGFFVEANATNDFCNGAATGDVCLGASSGNIVFSGTDGFLPAATLSSAGIFNVASGGDLRINGTSVRPCIIKITFSGTTPSVASSTGCSSPSVSRNSTGSYTFTDANITGLIAVCTPNSSSGGPYLQTTVSIGSGSSIIDNFAVPGTASVLADIPSGASLTCMFTR